MPKTLKEKVAMYEGLLHEIQLNSEVTLNNERLHKLIMNINDWSYAHRRGNGEYSEKEQQKIIDNAFEKLCD